MFVDATKLIQRPQRRMEPEFTETNKWLLQDILEDRQEVSNISFLVKNEDILNVGEWTLGRYQKEDAKTTARTMLEIDAELEDCYKQLGELENRNRKLHLFQRKS